MMDKQYIEIQNKKVSVDKLLKKYHRMRFALLGSLTLTVLLLLFLGYTVVELYVYENELVPYAINQIETCIDYLTQCNDKLEHALN